MAFFQPYLSHPGAPGAGTTPGAGFPPLTSQGYITNTGGQQYIQMPPTTFFPQQNLQRTYADVSPPPPSNLQPVPSALTPQHRIELNPNAAAYRSYTSPSPPSLLNSQQYPGRGGQRQQGVYQADASPQYQGQPLFRPYQNGPELVGIPKNQPQRPVTPHRLKSPIQTFDVPAPSFGGPSMIQPAKHENNNGLTRSYPDDQSVFVKDSDQGMVVSSTSAEDLFKAKASLYGIEICTKAESRSISGRATQLPCKFYSNKLSNVINTRKPTEMLFQKTHIEPEHSNDSDDSTTSSLIGESSACLSVLNQKYDSSHIVDNTVPQENSSPACDKVSQEPFCGKDSYYSENIENPYLITPVEMNGLVVYSEKAEHEHSLEEKNQSKEISGHLMSKEGHKNSGECDSFKTAGDEYSSSASDNGEMGIFGNYVLEALRPSKSPKRKETDTVQEALDGPAAEKEQGENIEVESDSAEWKDAEEGDTFESLIKAYVRTIIKKASEVVARDQECKIFTGECGDTEDKNADDTDIGNFNHGETAVEKLDCEVENFQKTKHQDDADDKLQNKSADTKVEHQIDAVGSVSEESSSGPASSSWAQAWNTKNKSKDENSNYCNNDIEKVRRFHDDLESTDQSSDYSDSGSASQLNPSTPEFKPQKHLKNRSSSINASTMRPDAPVFQPLNVQILPQSVKRKLKEQSCQTEEKEYKEVASNTRRVKQVDHVSETVSCDTREVCVNTMDSCFSEDTEYFVAEEIRYSEQGTLTESLDKKSIGVLVKPYALDACMVSKETMTEPVPDYLERLIATQRELLHLRGDVCISELKRQIDDLERSKQMFQNMRGESLDKVLDDRITSLKIELNIIQNQVISYDAHLQAGNVWKSVPLFTVSIPVGGQNIIAVIKDLKQKPSVPNVGTKRSYWDSYSSEDLRRDHPAKIGSKAQNHQPDESLKPKTEAFQLKPPQSFCFTSESTEARKIKDTKKLEQTTCQEVKTEMRDVPSSEVHQAPVTNMDDIDDNVSLPELTKTPLPKQHTYTAPVTGDRASDHVKEEYSAKSEQYTSVQRVCKGEPSAFKESVSQTLDNGPVSVSQDSQKVLLSDPEGLSRSANSISESGIQNINFTSFSNRPSVVNSTTSSSVPAVVAGKQSSSSTVNTRNITNPVQTSNRHNVSSVEIAPLLTGAPLLATPRIIPGQKAMTLFPQVHQATPYIPLRQPQPSAPPYPVVPNVQPSLLPYSQVLPVQPSLPSYPVVKAPLLPQPQPAGNISTSINQVNKIFPSGQTGQATSSSQGMFSGQGTVSSTVEQKNTTSSAPIQTKTLVSLGQTSNSSEQRQSLPEQVNSTVVEGQKKGSSSIPSSNPTSCPVTTSVQSSKPSGTVTGPSVDPDLYQAVINQLRQAYPQMATDPVWLETVGAQQTLVLQNYIEASKTKAPKKDTDNTISQLSNSSNNTISQSLNSSNNNSGLDSQKKEDSSKSHSYSKSEVPNGDRSQSEVNVKPRSVVDESCLMKKTSVTARLPPGFSCMADTDQSLSQKFESFPDLNMKDLGGGAKGFVKAVSDLTKQTGNESKDVSLSEQHMTGDDRPVVQKNSTETKLSQKPMSLLDNFKRVENPVVHEPKVSSVYMDTFEKQEYSTSKDMDLNPIQHSIHTNRSKNTHQHMLKSESVRNPSQNSLGRENWEDEVDQDPKPFRHDFRKVRPAERTKSSWLAEMSKTNLPPGLPLKKPTEKTTEGLNSDRTSGMSVIAVPSKGTKTTGDLDSISDGEGENWHQVSKKKKEKKKTDAERPRRKSGSDASSKGNNFEKLIGKMSEVFTTLSREKIIQLITEVRTESKGLSGMNMKQIINLSRQIFISKRNYYQADPKQRHPSGGSPTPNAQKPNKPVPLPIVGMSAMPGPGKTFNFKPLSMSVIQPLKDVPLIDDEEEICVICHDALIIEEIKTLDCGHVFHSSCIKQWVFGQERTCPNCRRLALFPEEFPRLGK